MGHYTRGNWLVLIRGFGDPRVRVMQYSQLRIEKITDQGGNRLLPLVLANSTTMANSLRPTVSWSSSASLSAAPGVSRIKELRAGVALSLLEKEKTVSIDLTKEAAPIDGPRGQITVALIPGANGTSLLRITCPPAAGANPLPLSTVNRTLPLTIRVFDKDGKGMQSALTSLGIMAQLSSSVQAANGPPSKVELTWPEKMRDMVLPVELNDIEVPALVPAVRPIARALPAVVLALPFSPTKDFLPD